MMPKWVNYTYSLADPGLARMIRNKMLELDPTICLLQECWTFAPTILGEDYHILGQNDSIAIKKSFGSFRPGSFRSHSFRFKQNADAPIVPDPNDPVACENQHQCLAKEPYDGTINSPYGIPIDFDVTRVIVDTPCGKSLLLVNVHVQSAPWKDQLRATQLDQWILQEAIPLAQNECENRILIGGDFNHDEHRQASGQSAHIMRQILQQSRMSDAASSDPTWSQNTIPRPTTNLPRIIKAYRFDHLYGTANFSQYRVQQSLTDAELMKFKSQHRMTWWLYLDHRNVSAEFNFDF
jgi:hypothetical protein